LARKAVGNGGFLIYSKNTILFPLSEFSELYRF